MIYSQKKKNLNKSIFENTKQKVYDYCEYKMLVRPGARNFLNSLFKKYVLVIYTAARRDYAEFVRSILDPNKVIFDAIYCREHCTYDASNDIYIKDLNIVDDDVDRVILLDNRKCSFRSGQLGLHIPDYRGQKNDGELNSVFKCINEILSNHKFKEIFQNVAHKYNLSVYNWEIEVNV